MKEFFKSFISLTLDKSKNTEKFSENSNDELLQYLRSERFAEITSAIIVYTLYILLLLFVGKFLWNNVIAGYRDSKGFFTFVKPVNSVVELFAIYIFITIFFS